MDDALEELQREKKMRKLQELFRGRFSEVQARRLLTHHGWALEITVDFVFEAQHNQVKEIAGTEDDRWLEVLNRRAWRELARQKRIDSIDIRQFACRPCDSVWWRRVPGRKTVSKCHRCRIRYDAVPKESEWGVAEFTCGNCGNVFKGFGQMNNTFSPCYVCNDIAQPSKIFPKMRPSGERRRHTHSCYASNCFNRADGDILPGICVHPKSLGRKVVTPSDQHISSGSTVDTFLTQDDLASISSASSRPNLSDIDEDN